MPPSPPSADVLESIWMNEASRQSTRLAAKRNLPSYGPPAEGVRSSADDPEPSESIKMVAGPGVEILKDTTRKKSSVTVLSTISLNLPAGVVSAEWRWQPQTT